MFGVVVSIDAHLLLGEVIHELVSHGPDSSEQNADLDSIEFKQSAWEVSLHDLDDLLDVFVGHLGSADAFKVEDGGPVLNFTWDHSMGGYVIKEEDGRFHDKVDVALQKKTRVSKT